MSPRKIIILVFILFLIVVAFGIFINTPEKDQSVLNENLISDLAVKNHLPNFDKIEITNYAGDFATAKLSNAQKNSAQIVFLKKIDNQWQITKEVNEKIGFSCKEMAGLGFEGPMLAGCSNQLDDAQTVSDFLNSNNFSSNFSNVPVVGQIYFNNESDCHCASIVDGDNKIEIEISDANTNGVADGDTVVVNVSPNSNNSDNTPEIIANKIVEVNTSDSNTSANPDISNLDPDVVIPDNSYHGSLLDRNFSNLPIQIIGDEGTFK